jgi:hypothetical protein
LPPGWIPDPAPRRHMVCSALEEFLNDYRGPQATEREPALVSKVN